MATKHMKRCSSLAIRKMQMLQDIITHLSQWPEGKIMTIPNVTEDAQILDHLHMAGGNLKSYNYSGKVGQF